MTASACAGLRSLQDPFLSARLRRTGTWREELDGLVDGLVRYGLVAFFLDGQDVSEWRTLGSFQNMRGHTGQPSFVFWLTQMPAVSDIINVLEL